MLGIQSAATLLTVGAAVSLATGGYLFLTKVQRVAAARMFARPAELLVVDDLSSALDVHTERLLWKRLPERPDLTCRLHDHGTRSELLGRSDELRQLRESEL
jgi:ATP-binding cassette subfamily B protein